MKDLITRTHKHLLWKDELNDPFLLLRYGELYQYSKSLIRVVSWSKRAFNNLMKICPIFNEWHTDDGLYIADINRADLMRVIEAWAPKKRFAKDSKWIKDKEKRLAHRIFPYNPKLEEVENANTLEEIRS